MALTAAKLNNADQDCATLEQVVNGAASPGTLTSRLGRSLSTVAKVIADIQAALSSALSAFMAALPSWSGAWNSATAYTAGKCVTYGGSSYVAIQAGTNHVPTDTAYWALIAQTGDVSQARTQNNDWTGVNTFSGGLSTLPGNGPPNAGDIRAARSATPTVGAVYLGNTTTEYVGFDGTRYMLGTTNKPIKVGTPVGATDAVDVLTMNGMTVSTGVIRGLIVGVGSATLSNGSPGTTVSRTGVGNYRITNSRITTTSVGVLSGNSHCHRFLPYAGYADVTSEFFSGGSLSYADDPNLTFVIYP